MSGSVDLSELDSLEAGDPDRIALERAAANLHRRGFDFTVEHGVVMAGRSDKDRTLALDFGKDHIRLGLVSDTHGGSRSEQLTALRQFYALCDKERVDAFIHAGDFVQGSSRMHLGMENELHAFGADAQVGYVSRTYPQSKRKGILTYAIAGNHDTSFLKDGGVNVVRQIAAKRPDVVYVGQEAAYLSIARLSAYVMHPDGGVPYAKSYRGQKIAASLPLDRQVSLLVIGHLHVYSTVKERDTFVITLPCFQGQYPYLARKGLHPDVGGVIMDIWLDADGRPRKVKHELVSFPTLDDDWDHEASAAVSRSWSPEGVAA